MLIYLVHKMYVGCLDFVFVESFTDPSISTYTPHLEMSGWGDLVMTDLRDTLLVLATVENGPSNATGVLALKEERLGLAVLEAEDLAVATDEQLTLQ